MIYIRYITKGTLGGYWSIYGHEKGSKEETLILDSTGDTGPYTRKFTLKPIRDSCHIKYLTQEEIDLLKLEYL